MDELFGILFGGLVLSVVIGITLLVARAERRRKYDWSRCTMLYAIDAGDFDCRLMSEDGTCLGGMTSQDKCSYHIMSGGLCEPEV